MKHFKRRNSLCLKIIEEHMGGRLYAQNIDDGSRFVIELEGVCLDEQ